MSVRMTQGIVASRGRWPAGRAFGPFAEHGRSVHEIQLWTWSVVRCRIILRIQVDALIRRICSLAKETMRCGRMPTMPVRATPFGAHRLPTLLEKRDRSQVSIFKGEGHV